MIGGRKETNKIKRSNCNEEGNRKKINGKRENKDRIEMNKEEIEE